MSFAAFAGRIRAQLFDHARIITEENNATGGWKLAIEIDRKHLGLLESVVHEEIH